MKVALIGGAGFIGNELAKNLIAQGHDIGILDIQPSPDFPDKYVEADITNTQDMMDNLAGYEAIIHLAAAHRDDVFPRSIYYDVNVKGTDNIIAAAKAHGIKRIVFTSTVAVYGLNSGDSKETDAPAPFNEYGKSKLKAEEKLRAWEQETDEACLVLTRLVATFGPGNRGNIYTLIDQIHKGRFLMIGSGKNAKSIAYIGNVVAFLGSTLKFRSGTHLYNYADKPDLDMIVMVNEVREKFGYGTLKLKIPYFAGICGGFIFDILSRITGKTFPISTIRIRKFCSSTIVCCDKVRQELDFSPPFSLKQGLHHMIDEDF